MRGIMAERVASRERHHNRNGVGEWSHAPFDCDYSIESIGSTRIMFTPTIFQNPA